MRLVTYAKLALIGALALAPHGALAQAAGTVVVGLNSAIPAVDPHFMNSQRDANLWPHVFESLMTIGEGMNPVEQLADSYELSDDGLTLTFHLRKGVLFHNGRTMNSADVLASWERYKKSSPGAPTLSKVAGMAAPDESTFVVTLSERQPLLLEAISTTTFPLVIIPAEEATKGKGEISPIGTGPYRFVEQVPDDRVVIERFPDYVADADGTAEFNGYAGRRSATIERIVFRAIPEGGTRIAGLQTGELTIADNLPVPAAKRLTDAGLVAQDVMPFSKAGVPFNTSLAPTDNVLIRRAIQAATNAEEIMEVALEGFYRLDPSLVFDFGLYYPGDVLAPYYNQNNPEKAKALLAEAGYKGETIRILTNTNFAFMQNTALVMAEQLKAAGMTVEIDIVDWPTNIAALVDGSGNWNLTPIGYGSQPIAGPAVWLPVLRQHTRLTSAPEYDELSAALLREPSLEKRQELWKQIELHIQDQAYFLPMGDRGMKVVSTTALSGYHPYYSMRFWNVSLK